MIDGVAPWDIRSSDTRVEDSLPTFIIFCEDEVSEVNYFSSFQTDKIKVNPIPKQKQGFDNVVRAISHCKKYGRLEDKKRLYVWCVYDRDIQSKSINGDLEDTEFDESIKMAHSKGINVAWSNDCFEVWILLHFDAPDEDFIIRHNHRDKCYDRLTEIFSEHENDDEKFIRIKNSGHFSYKEHLKKKQLFLSVVKPVITPLTHIAIERAKTLDLMHASAEPHKRIPCTRVHELVELLLSEGT